MPGTASPRRRDGFALTGRSVALDPTTHAVRPDLADVRLASQVFAPHYAAPMPRIVTAPTPLRRARGSESEVLVTLAAGAAFELLDLMGEDAWGIASADQLVGYLDRRVLGEPAA